MWMLQEVQQTLFALRSQPGTPNGGLRGNADFESSDVHELQQVLKS